jgi:hypothetical protein
MKPGTRRNIILRCSIFLDIFVQCNIFCIDAARIKLPVGGIDVPAQRGRTGPERHQMFKKLEEMQTISQTNVDAATASWGALSKSFQAIASEFSDYSRKVFEDGATATEKLLNAKTVEMAAEVQQAYMKSAYEGFVAQSTKLGELYTGLAQEFCKPVYGAQEPHSPRATASK